MSIKYVYLIVILYLFIPSSHGQELTSSEVKSLVNSYKNDIRGPYYRIKWFCKDGTIRDPKDPCPDDIGGGIQHASFKQSAIDLRRSNALYFGDILAALEKEDFLDAKHNYNRLKQYQINKYLASVDDGWILRKGQYYRGAIQSEDEEAWGLDFFKWLLKNDDFIASNYYLTRQALKDIPHNGDSNLAQLMRSQSKAISEDYSPFMDLRIKIHGQPESSDIRAVKSFYQNKKNQLTDAQRKEFNELIKTMESFYAPINFSDLKKDIDRLPKEIGTTNKLYAFIENAQNNNDIKEMSFEISEILNEIRDGILEYSDAEDRLSVLDMSNQLEHYLLSNIQEWQPQNLKEIISKIETLACASAGTGLIETWEFNQIEEQLNTAYGEEEISIKALNNILDISRSVVEWSAAMVKANYQKTVDTYVSFEPLAYGFIDDRVRSSIALSLGETVSTLGSEVAVLSNLSNKVLNVSNQGTIRGLNPGYAKGELVVVDGNPDGIEVSTDKIYVFQRPPADLKPVAGIMTVSEGNLVSHVQLLARNLGIPNAALSYDNLKELKSKNGQVVFYAVSPKGNVILKSEAQMNSKENLLFSKTERSKSVITVPVDQIKLEKTSVVNMRDVDASDSGKLCGPKAANLGELKKLFPDQVVEGLIIPFGIFRKHMDKDMPGQSQSYWTYLNSTFAEADKMREEGKSDEEIESFQLVALEKLHKAIINISLGEDFVKDFQSSFESIFGKPIGEVPVFLRSDTNMEDLKEFTGAGLNLTLFNIVDKDAILNGIKRVWASAYTERSFKWRQKYLSNPENVFPSILIIPSVDVDYSGVMITKGINSGNDEDLTVAFSRGAGGAVDGQSAETRLITKESDYLLAPARQPDYIRLPQKGGTETHFATFQEPILNVQNIEDIRTIAKTVRDKMTEDTGAKDQAYDVEFGFKDNKLWLFQIRPFVENKKAKSSEYLNSISPKISSDKKIDLTRKI